MQNDHRPAGLPHEPGSYEIRLTGHLDARWSALFEGLVIHHAADGTTVLTGLIVDQAALHGLLQRVRDLGIPLVSVNRADRDPEREPGTQPEI